MSAQELIQRAGRIGPAPNAVHKNNAIAIWLLRRRSDAIAGYP